MLPDYNGLELIGIFAIIYTACSVVGWVVKVCDEEYARSKQSHDRTFAAREAQQVAELRRDEEDRVHAEFGPMVEAELKRLKGAK